MLPFQIFPMRGKDSFLAYHALKRAGRHNVVLLTSFDARSRIIAHQEFGIETVVEQAVHLGLPLIGVPLHAGAPYIDPIAAALALVPQCDQLCFGDLHLETIRQWRIQTFADDPRTSALELSFPLWRADWDALLDDFEASGAQATISALSADLPGVSIGDPYDRALVARLPAGVDPFGENGEFHTQLRLTDPV